MKTGTHKYAVLWIRIGFHAGSGSSIQITADPDLDPGFWVTKNCKILC
jgi:hypothetical protein